jgi:hypothetical protein
MPIGAFGGGGLSPGAGVTVQGQTPQLAFGSYLFPITFQETSRLVTLPFDKKHIPFNYGDMVAVNTSPSARDIQISGPVGSLIVGSSGNTLVTAADLEAERGLLAGLQLLGRQALWVGPQQYIFAYLESFEHKFWQDAYGWRVADWVLKFYCDDPRYYSSLQTMMSDTVGANLGMTTVGNVRTYPTFTFSLSSGSGIGPYVTASASTGSLMVRFSQLIMVAGSTLVIQCDPRPNTRSAAALYTAAGVTVNALQYISVANNDLSNNYDVGEWFPFIDPHDGGINLIHGFTSGSPTCTFTAQYNDRYL